MIAGVSKGRFMACVVSQSVNVYSGPLVIGGERFKWENASSGQQQSSAKSVAYGCGVGGSTER